MSGVGASRVIVGRAYLETHPAEASADRLLALLGMPAADADAAQPWIRQRIAEDFRAGRTVLVRGWVLAETEARVCALAALGAAGPTRPAPASERDRPA